MNKNLKITLTVFSAFLFSFTLLFIYLDLSTFKKIQSNEDNVYSSLQQVNEKSIFLIGSSYVVVIDESFIQKYFSSKQVYNFKVYNLGIGGDSYSKRIKFLDELVLADPTAAVFGVGFRDAGYKEYEKNKAPPCTMDDVKGFGISNNLSVSVPKIQDFSKYFQLSLFEQATFNIPNPKQVTIENLRLLFNDENSVEGLKEGIENDDKNLFPNNIPNIQTIQNLEENDKPSNKIIRVCQNDLDKELSSLKELILGLKEKNVKVILFVPPYTNSYLNSVGEKNIQIFLEIMNNFSSENDVKFYNFIGNYTDLEIWRNWSHVSSNPRSMAYSEDIAKMILKEIESNNQLRNVDVSSQNLMYQDLSNADLRQYDLSGKDLTGVSLQNANLVGANINNTILREANLAYASLEGVNLSGKDLTGTILIGAILDNVDFTGVDLAGKDFTGASLKGVDLSNKDLTGTILIGAILDNVDFTGVDLAGKDFTGASLKGVDLSNKDLTRTFLRGVDLSGKDLSGTILKETKLMGANLAGIDLSGKDLTGTIMVRAILDNVNFTGVDLSGKNLRYVSLKGVDLSNINLMGASLADVDLSGKDLTGTILIGAILDNVDFTGVDLAGKDFTGASLKRVDLSYKDLTGTILKDADLTGTNLTGIVGGPFLGCVGHSLCE